MRALFEAQKANISTFRCSLDQVKNFLEAGRIRIKMLSISFDHLVLRKATLSVFGRVAGRSQMQILNPFDTQSFFQRLSRKTSFIAPRRLSNIHNHRNHM